MPAHALTGFRDHVAKIQVSDVVLDYSLDLCDVLSGQGHLSARASHSLLALARVLAVLSGRPYVVPDDIKHLAVPALAHRLGSEGERVDARAEAVRTALDNLSVPAPTG
jgi:MoxR-like ATPase